MTDKPVLTAEEIKARVDMPALIVYLRDGEPIPEDRIIRCLLHDDKSPSMMVNEETCYCFACEVTWDVIQMVRDFHSLGFFETLAWFEEHMEDLEDEVEAAEVKAAPPKVTTSVPLTRILWSTGTDFLQEVIVDYWLILVCYQIILSILTE